ncbi:MAG: ABC transporter ATP-binding protein [Geminicoccaceae bacterium]
MTVIVGTFFAGVLDLIGITMIIPLIASASQTKENTKGIVIAMQNAFAKIGVPFEASAIVIIIVVGMILKGLVQLVVTKYVGETVAEVSRQMQLRLIRSLLAARWNYFMRQSVGRLAFATGPEASAAGECFQHVTSLIAGILQSCLFLLVAALISWELLALVLLVAVVMFVSFGSLVQRGRALSKTQRALMRQNSAKFTDAMIGIKPIRAMGRSDRFVRLFEDDIDQLASTTRSRILSGEFAADLQEPIIGVLVAVGLFVALNNLALPLHDVVIMAILLVRTINSLLPLQRIAQKFIQTYDQYKTLNELLQATEEARELTNGTVRASLRREIRLEKVSFAYDQKRVLTDLDMVIARGKITTIAGPSGVGKSTIVDLVLGLQLPDAGRITIDDIDLREVDLRDWRKRIGYVPQEVSLFHDTVFNNVALWEEGITDEDVIEALKKAGAWKFVERMPQQLESIVGERGLKISGGQRQRISLARGLLHRPDLLVLDEATTGLDPVTETAICEEIRGLCDRDGLTVLAVSHQPTWQQVADVLYRIEDGAAVLVGGLEKQPSLLTGT